LRDLSDMTIGELEVGDILRANDTGKAGDPLIYSGKILEIEYSANRLKICWSKNSGPFTIGTWHAYNALKGGNIMWEGPELLMTFSESPGKIIIS
jgi:hypothetical protein